MKIELPINTAAPQIMWIDLNSAFAMAEQQAHPSLRGKPVAVTNRLSRECCVIACSYEAKRLGIKVGTRRSEAMRLCPSLVMLETDPPKYHNVYTKLRDILQSYSPVVTMRSIDEGMVDFSCLRDARQLDLSQTGMEIKQRVKDEIGDYMSINVGIGPNRFLAKVAAGLHKPDGLDIIDSTNLRGVMASLELQDLYGIAHGYGRRLRMYGINTALDFLEAEEELLSKHVFKSVDGTKWYRRLRGYEVDDQPTNLSMVGREWVVHDPGAGEEYLRSCLHHLCDTAALKLRYRCVEARGVCVMANFRVGGRFKEKHVSATPLFSNEDIWRVANRLFDKRPRHLLVNKIAVLLYKIEPSRSDQAHLLEHTAKARLLSGAVDDINDRHGLFTIQPADSLLGSKTVKQKIPFGGTDYFNLLLKKQ